MQFYSKTYIALLFLNLQTIHKNPCQSILVKFLPAQNYFLPLPKSVVILNWFEGKNSHPQAEVAHFYDLIHEEFRRAVTQQADKD